jgi:superfamily I DNA/RNA helicase
MIERRTQIKTLGKSVVMKNWSTFQSAIFNFIQTGKGSGVVEAVAGSGKTTTIVEGIRSMQGKVALMAYNTKMANELQARVAGMPNVKAATCHSFGNSAFWKAGIKPTLLNDGKGKVGRILDDILTREELSLVPFLKRLVSFAKSEGVGFIHPMLDQEVWQGIIDHHDMTIEGENTAGFTFNHAIGLAQKALVISNQQQNLIDFDDMVYLPLMLGMRLVQYDWVLIDEAQDINATRLALAKAMLKPSGRLIAVGDPDQAIFGFTGAESDALEKIKREFNASTFPLSVCYRCGTNIINHAQQWNPNILPFEGNPAGEVREIKWEDFAKDFATWGFSGSDAILCRKNAPLAKLAFSLIRKGIPCRIEGKNIGDGLKALAKRWKVQQLTKLNERLDTYQSREVEKWEKKDNALQADVVRDKVATLKILIERCNEQGVYMVTDLINLIDSMFSDSVAGQKPNIVTLSSVHKSKGLEWDRVFLLDRKQFMPSKMAKLDWQMKQEDNLIYVAITRAIATLIEITDSPTPH